MSMNPYIAEMYNTNGFAEKVASIELITTEFIKQAAAEGLDLSGLSDDQIVDYAIDWANEQNDLQTDESSEKIAEADYMGRVMAHAYVDEMSKIAEDPTTRDVNKNRTPKFRQLNERTTRQSVPNSIEDFKETRRVDSPSVRAPSEKATSVRAPSEKATSVRAPSEKATSVRVPSEAAGSVRDEPATTREMRDRARDVKSGAKGLLARADQGIRGLGRRIAGGEKLREIYLAAAKDGGQEAGRAAARRAAAIRGYGAVGAGGLLAAGGLGAGIYAATRKKESHVAALYNDAVDYANELLYAAEGGEDVTLDKIASVLETEYDADVADLAWLLLEEKGYIG